MVVPLSLLQAQVVGTHRQKHSQVQKLVTLELGAIGDYPFEWEFWIDFGILLVKFFKATCS